MAFWGCVLWCSLGFCALWVFGFEFVGLYNMPFCGFLVFGGFVYWWLFSWFGGLGFGVLGVAGMIASGWVGA